MFDTFGEVETNSCVTFLQWTPAHERFTVGGPA